MDSLHSEREAAERDLMRRVLSNPGQSRTRAAEQLGISRVTLNKRRKNTDSLWRESHRKKEPQKKFLLESYNLKFRAQGNREATSGVSVIRLSPRPDSAPAKRIVGRTTSRTILLRRQERISTTDNTDKTDKNIGILEAD